MRRGRRSWKKLLLIFLLIVMSVIWIIGKYQLTTQALESDPFQEPVKLRCTCYIDQGITVSGKMTRPGIMAARREWIGCVAEVNEVNEDGSVGEFIGYYEILDTGYGIETGVGESQILKGRTKGTIETGDTVDIWMPTLDAAQEWVKTHGDYVYVKLFKGEG